MAQVIAHRGARSIAPENTLIAAEIAWQKGADLWETDVNVTRDGRLVLFHDETLFRCTDAVVKFPSRKSYLLREFTFEEIEQLDAGSYFIQTDPFFQIVQEKVPSEAFDKFKTAAVPSLEQGLELTRHLDWKINLELKDHGHGEIDLYIPEKTLEIIGRSRIPTERVVISSFNHEWLRYIRKAQPRIELQALLGEDDNSPLNFGDFDFNVYNLNAGLVDDDLIITLKVLGKKINLFTVNDSESFNRFDRLGVDGMFTDFPQLFAGKPLVKE